MLSLTEAHQIARQRFEQNPLKCYQRHIREVWAEIEQRPTLESLKGAIVRRIPRTDAEPIILKYEWLAADPLHKNPLGRGITACYGLCLNNELLGANCLGITGQKIGLICPGRKTVCLMRGACVPHAPDNAASFFTRNTCRQAFKDFGWEVFFAYSDVDDAGEVGTIYQACGWYYIGQDTSHHYDYEKDGRRITSYELNHQRKTRKTMKSLGWTPEAGEMRPWLRAHGWKQITRNPKHKWVWFEGPDREKIKESCRYPFKPYPKRTLDSTPNS